MLKNNKNSNNQQFNIYQRETRHEASTSFKSAHNFEDTALFPLLAFDTIETALISVDNSIKIPLYIDLHDKQITVPSLLDTGASLSIIKRKFAQTNNLSIKKVSKSFNCRTGNGFITVTHQIKLLIIDQDHQGDEKATKF